MSSNLLWQECLQQLSQELSENIFDIWLRPLKAQVAEDFSQVEIELANRFKLNYFRSQYLALIENKLREIYGQDVKVKLKIKAAKSKTASVASAAAAAKPKADEAGSKETSVKSVAAAVRKARAGNNLDPKLTFAAMVEGSANKVARAAAMHVSNQAEPFYNPLFIYGGVGLGKTHLMHAIGNQLLQINPQAKILYTHSERFVSDVVKNYQHKTFDAFRNKYHSLDLLLIDDVQFFAGKERSQEEFFNAFEALLQKQSQIVMTSDTYPKEMASIHERLRSRFDSGLTVVLDPPELELRVAILASKAKQEKVKLAEDVAFFIAKHVRSNVRELEGALRKVLAYSKFNNQAISIAMAKEALRDLLSIQSRIISVEGIQKTVADYYKIKIADMHSKKRPANIARPRQIAMYLAKELTQKSLPEIGDSFGGRDHTTVLHAVKKIAKLRQSDDNLARELGVLEQTLKN